MVNVLDGLVRWLVGNQCVVHEQWAFEKFHGRGVGLVAVEDLPVGKMLFEIHHDVLVLGNRFDLTEWLVRERVRATECREQDCAGRDWGPFVDSFPTTRDRLPVQSIFVKALELEDPRDAEDSLVGQAIEFCPKWIEELPGGIGRWLMALGVVSARMHAVWIRDAFGDWVVKTALVPLADLLNGCLKSQGCVNVQCETRKSDGFFICKTTKAVNKGGELMVQYGDDSADESDLALTYGFS
mmetsp:Transcript_6672/g.10518  ORF Transcript_6672/g.10518 Transcript_6672/m.10518 type:complete len:240 (+) Transcript_6672:132-851(+)